MTTTVHCANTPHGFECVAHRNGNDGACELKPLPLFEVVYLSGGSVYSAGVAEFKQVADREADRLRRHRGMNTSVRPYRPLKAERVAHAKTRRELQDERQRGARAMFRFMRSSFRPGVARATDKAVIDYIDSTIEMLEQPAADAPAEVPPMVEDTPAEFALRQELEEACSCRDDYARELKSMTETVKALTEALKDAGRSLMTCTEELQKKMRGE